MDAALIVLHIRPSNNEAAAALKDPRNAEFLVPVSSDTPEPPTLDYGRRDGTPFVERSPLEAVLRTDRYPFDPALGWVFGREGEGVDFVLGDRHQGVSQKHFRIDHNWKALTLMLVNLSGNYTAWRNPETGRVEKFTGSRAIIGEVEHQIGVGSVWLTLQIPVRTKEEQARHDVRIKQLREEVAMAAPAIQGLKVAPLDAELTPFIIGRFALGRVIGKGVTAAVREAVDRTTGDRFAAKEYTLATKGALRSTLREIKLLQELKHKHIVEYVALYQNPDPVLIMELALKSLEECTIASTRECVTLLQHVLSGLAFLHAKNVMHRDIKPANILLTHESPAEWKLSDFGLSKVAEITGTFCGSLLYMAPEIDGLVGSVYTNAVDVWSVGVVGLEYSCGFDVRHLERVYAPRQHKAWCNAVARRAKSKESVLAEHLAGMLHMIPTARPTARVMLDRLLGWSDAAESGPRYSDDHNAGKGKEREESEEKSLEDDGGDKRDATTICLVADEEETKENASIEVRIRESSIAANTGKRRSSRKRTRVSPD